MDIRTDMGNIQQVDTVVVGAGQAGLATSYWLREAGREHLVLERRATLGGSWQDRWDSFRLITPNFVLQLPGMPYDGADPEAFLDRNETVALLRRYAAEVDPPVVLNTGVDHLAVENGGFRIRAGDRQLRARNVVLATGPYPRPKLPVFADAVPDHILQLHTDDYRRPEQLPEGAVLVVGSGQSGTQIAEELQDAGRQVHLAVSMCPAAPRRYRGRDFFWWLAQMMMQGPRYGLGLPDVKDLPTPAARFQCHPHLVSDDGGRGTSLRELAHRGMRLYGRLESIHGPQARFSDDLARRLAFAETAFDLKFKPVFDVFAAAAGIDAPPDSREDHDTRYTPSTSTELDLEAAGIGTVLWATGYRLDFDWLDVPILDEWGYPRHTRGVTEQPGLYAVGLPWLHTEGSATIPGVGADAAHIVQHIAARAASDRQPQQPAPAV